MRPQLTSRRVGEVFDLSRTPVDGSHYRHSWFFRPDAIKYRHNTMTVADSEYIDYKSVRVGKAEL